MIEVIKPGALSLFQDHGRLGFQKLGVPAAGPMDANAHRLANLLVGNDPAVAALEITLLGPMLRFEQPTGFALAGADLSPRLNRKPLAMHRPHVAEPGDILDFGPPQRGCRAYFSVHGGFQLQPVLGSCSTYVKGNFGGLHGGALRAGDRIPILSPLASDPVRLEACREALWEVVVYLSAGLGPATRRSLRILRGPQWDLFEEEARRALLNESFEISSQSDRMGFRLSGPRLRLASDTQILSEATALGAIQVPQGGDPILLMADRQTMGGYPKIAYLAGVDLPLLAQCLPSERLRFTLITLEEAQELDLRREQAFSYLAESLAPIGDVFRSVAT